MPQRRCVGCGRVAPKSELVRLAVNDQRSTGENGGRTRLAVLDRTGTIPGRGAYLCRDGASGAPSTDCVALSTQRSALARALRCSVEISPELVESLRGWRSRPQAGEAGRVGPDKFPIIR